MHVYLHPHARTRHNNTTNTTNTQNRQQTQQHIYATYIYIYIKEPELGPEAKQKNKKKTRKKNNPKNWICRHIHTDTIQIQGQPPRAPRTDWKQDQWERLVVGMCLFMAGGNIEMIPWGPKPLEIIFSDRHFRYQYCLHFGIKKTTLPKPLCPSPSCVHIPIYWYMKMGEHRTTNNNKKPGPAATPKLTKQQKSTSKDTNIHTHSYI